jgi:hypothetical protein
MTTEPVAALQEFERSLENLLRALDQPMRS